MKKIIALVFIGLVIATARAFAQTPDTTRGFEASNDFAEIKWAFQRKLYEASSKYKYFHHQLEGFVVNLEFEDELSKKTKKDISKNQYFIFETTDRGIYYLTLVNKENANAIVFYFFNYSYPWFGEENRSSRAGIDKALADYPEL
jgi:hypothetical protein